VRAWLKAKGLLKLDKRPGCQACKNGGSVFYVLPAKETNKKVYSESSKYSSTLNSQAASEVILYCNENTFSDRSNLITSIFDSE
jgi:hypothetical protein